MTPYPIFHAVLAYALQFVFLIALIVLDPLYIPKAKDSKPVEASREARDIPLISSGDSILLHLPARKSNGV
jgi:hypothetical protein